MGLQEAGRQLARLPSPCSTGPPYLAPAETETVAGWWLAVLIRGCLYGSPLLQFLGLRSTEGGSCHWLWLASPESCDASVLWPLLQIPLCKQRSGLIAYGGIGCGNEINFRPSYSQPLANTQPLLLGSVCLLLFLTHAIPKLLCGPCLQLGISFPFSVQIYS